MPQMANHTFPCVIFDFRVRVRAEVPESLPTAVVRAMAGQRVQTFPSIRATHSQGVGLDKAEVAGRR